MTDPPPVPPPINDIEEPSDAPAPAPPTPPRPTVRASRTGTRKKMERPAFPSRTVWAKAWPVSIACVSKVPTAPPKSVM